MIHKAHKRRRGKIMIAHEFNSMLKQTEKLIGYKDLPAPHDGCLCASGPNETLVVARSFMGRLDRDDEGACLALFWRRAEHRSSHSC